MREMTQTDLVITMFAQLAIFLFASIIGGWMMYLIISWLLGSTDNNNSQISDILERQSEHDQWTHIKLTPEEIDKTFSDLLKITSEELNDGTTLWTIEPTTTTANKKFTYDHTNTNDPVYRIIKE